MNRAITLLLLASVAAATSAIAADERNTTSGITAAGAPLALHGYDAVAFFTESAPRLGDPALAVVHEGATYYFASKQSRAAFEARPQRYAPAFGGFCAFGVSVGKKFDGSPLFWTVSGDRLYLNLNRDISQKFKADVAGNIAKAQANWKKIEHTPVGEL
jgi:hypothetical protein